MSFIMANERNYFEVKITPESRRKVNIEENILVLAPFNNVPKLLFENVKVGTTKVQYITVRNPHDNNVEVQLEKLPPENLGLIFSAINFGVKAHEELQLEVTWTPSEAGSWHQVIQVKNSLRFRLNIILACTSLDSQKGKKRTVKPLRVKNVCSYSSLTAKKCGIKPLSHSKDDISCEVRSKSQVIKGTHSENKYKLKQLSSCNEQFTSIKGNILPPCTVPSTPTRRETYLVIHEIDDANKENAEFKQLPQRTNSANDILEFQDFKVKQLSSNDKLVTPPDKTFKNDSQNVESEIKMVTYNSHPHKSSLCTIGRKRVAKNSSPLVKQNFLDVLDSLGFTPTPSRSNKEEQSVASRLQYSSSEDQFPACNVSPTSYRRQTYEIPFASKFENESGIQLSEALRNAQSICMSDSKMPVESHIANDSLEEHDYVEEHFVFESRTKQWVEWQKCNFSNSEGSSEGSVGKCYDSAEKTPNSKISTTELTPLFTKLNLSSHESHLFYIDSPVDFSLASPTKDARRCSTLLKKMDQMHCDSVSDNLCKDLFSDAVTTNVNVSFADELHNLSSDTFIKYGSSFSDTNFQCPDISYQESKGQQKNSHKETKPRVAMNTEEDSAQHVVCDAVVMNMDPSYADELRNLSSEAFIKSGSSFPDLNFQCPDISHQESKDQQKSCYNETKPQVALNTEEDSAKNVIEAGLWVEPLSAEELSSESNVRANFPFLQIIEKGNKCINSSITDVNNSVEPEGKLSAICMKTSEKLENDNFGKVFLEISPPKRHNMLYSVSKFPSAEKLKTSRVTGWSKTSVKSKNYPSIRKSKGLSCQLDTIANMTGKKRPLESIQNSDIFCKKRIFGDGSVRGSSNIPRGGVARKPSRGCAFSSIPRRTFAKLVLSTHKKEKNETLKLHNPDAVLNKLANPDLFEATTTSEPFTTSSIYFDEEWMVQQEKEFTKWLNSLLTPPEELNSVAELPKVDVAKLWIQSCHTQEIAPAPTREVVSSKYHTHHRLDALRKAACSLFHSQEVAQILSKVAVHVEKKLIAIRNDRDLHLDFGLKCKVMELLLSYNPLWLRIGLEAIYGQIIPLESNFDVQGLAKFIATHLLSNTYIVQQNTHPTVSHLFLPGFEDAMKKFILKKFLLLIYFLDKAKERKLIKHDPCLFCKDAELKDSRHILLAFSRDLLAGVGDITKHLKCLGYVVTQRQTYLDEFEYAVNCLGTDLRDGIRLTRVMEIILQKQSLSRELRVPAVSRLQKLHNVNVALSALKVAGFTLSGDITAKDICDGHREKTLSLLWQIIYKFQAPCFVDAANKIQKWWRHQSLKLEIYRRIQARQLTHLMSAATKIQAIWRSYSAQKQFKILKEQETIKMAYRQKASIVIQKNWRMYLKRKQYNLILNSIKKIQTWYRNMKVVKIERVQYIRKRQTFVTFQAICRGFLFRKRLGNLQRTAAALKIQTWYRYCLTHQKIKSEQQHFLKQMTAATLIQRRFQAMLMMKKQVKWYQQQKSAAIIIQNKFRATRLMQLERKHFLKRKSAAVVIQRRFRATLLMKKQVMLFRLQQSAVTIIQNKFRATMLMQAERQHFLKQKIAATMIQRRFRATLLMKKKVKLYQQQKSAAIIIQNKYRATVLMQLERKHYLKQKSAAVVIQRRFRATLLMKKQVMWFRLQQTAATVIQNKFRATMLMQAERQHFLKQKIATTKIQRRFRATLLTKKQANWYQQQKSAATIIQKKFRATMLMRMEIQQFLKLKSAVVLTQRRFRATLLMKKKVKLYQQQKSAAIIIQNKYRATVLMQLEREHYLKQKSAAVVIQRRFRATLLMKKQVMWFRLQQTAATVIQNKFRATMLMQAERQHFLKQKIATTIIQRRFRATLLMKKQANWYQQQKSAATIIQKKFRATMLMRMEIQQFLKLKSAVVLTQRRFRATLLMKKKVKLYQQQKSAAIIIQKKFRATLLMQHERKLFLNLKFAVLSIQNTFRAKMLLWKERNLFLEKKSATLVIQRWFRSCLLKKKQMEWCANLNGRKEEYKKQTDAAIKIQALWRGYRERKTGTEEIVAMRERALSLFQNGPSGTTLETRSIAALSTLKRACSGRVIWALMELDTITQLSPKLCVDIANSSIVKIIYTFISNATRSEVDKDMSTVATKVLINLAKFEKTTASIWQVTGNVNIIMNLMSAWCGKNDPLFCNCCTLLWLFACDPVKVVDILNVPYVQQKLVRYQKQLKLKQDKAQTFKKGSNGSSKMKAKSLKCVLPSTKPDWSLRGFCLQQTFENPLHAVNSVIKQLNIEL